MERRVHPGDDLITAFALSQSQNNNISDIEILDNFVSALIAGHTTTTDMIGNITVANTLSFVWMYLSRHPEQRRYIIEHPGQINAIADEFLRHFAVPGGTSRRVRKDVEFHGVSFKAGDVILLAPTLPNRDPSVFERPDEILFERELKPNLTFGAGPHRCIGSHLAKSEVIIALQEWLPRIPDFSIAPGKKIRALDGQVMGMEDLPLSW